MELSSDLVVVTTAGRTTSMRIYVELVKALPGVAQLMLDLINGPILATERSSHGLPGITVPLTVEDCAVTGHTVAIPSIRSSSPTASLVVLRAREIHRVLTTTTILLEGRLQVGVAEPGAT